MSQPLTKPLNIGAEFKGTPMQFTIGAATIGVVADDTGTMKVVSIGGWQ